MSPNTSPPPILYFEWLRFLLDLPQGTFFSTTSLIGSGKRGGPRNTRTRCGNIYFWERNFNICSTRVTVSGKSNDFKALSLTFIDVDNSGWRG